MRKGKRNFSLGRAIGMANWLNISDISNDEMPRTPIGKILHRVLRERYGRG